MKLAPNTAKHLAMLFRLAAIAKRNVNKAIYKPKWLTVSDLLLSSMFNKLDLNLVKFAIYIHGLTCNLNFSQYVISKCKTGYIR